MTPEIQLLNVPGRPENPFYHHVSIARGESIIHVAGQVGSDAEGNLVDGGLAAQAEQAMRNVKTALEGAGASIDNLVKMTIYVVDWSPEKMEEFAAGMMAAGPGPLVPASLIGVSILFEPGYLIEIEATAVV